ncbi:hypothetical protein LguiA_031042 [Lonicera macranthoides]
MGKPNAPFKTPRKQASKPSVIRRSPRLIGKFKLHFSCTTEKPIALSDDEPDFSDLIEPEPLQPKLIKTEPHQTDPIENRKGKWLMDEADVYLPMICGLPNVGFSDSQSSMNDSGPYDYEAKDEADKGNIGNGDDSEDITFNSGSDESSSDEQVSLEGSNDEQVSLEGSSDGEMNDFKDFANKTENMYGGDSESDPNRCSYFAAQRPSTSSTTEGEGLKQKELGGAFKLAIAIPAVPPLRGRGRGSARRGGSEEEEEEGVLEERCSIHPVQELITQAPKSIGPRITRPIANPTSPNRFMNVTDVDKCALEAHLLWSAFTKTSKGPWQSNYRCDSKFIAQKLKAAEKKHCTMGIMITRWSRNFHSPRRSSLSR